VIQRVLASGSGASTTPESSPAETEPLDEDEYDALETACREAVRLDPGNAALHDDLGKVLLAHDKYAEAEAAYREAVRLEPGNAAYHDDLGKVLLAQDKYAEAEAAYQQAVRLEPGNAAYHDDVGQVLFAQHNYADAEAAQREAARLSPDEAVFRFNVAADLHAQGKHEEAEAAYQEALRLEAGNAAFHDDVDRIAAGASETERTSGQVGQPAEPDQPSSERQATAAELPSLDVLLGQLDGLTGLAPVKAEVLQLIDMVRAEQMRRAAALPVSQVSRHLVFTGNPGTGKTMVARLLGQLYAAIGVLGTGQLVEVTRSDLVAGYVGQTAIKTTEAVNRALGGILFIDEAYALTRSAGSGQVDFGQEAVDTLVKLMEDHRHELVVIVAGYGEEMAQFISANPGLPSRFPRTIHFPDYSTDELLSIFKGICEHDGYEISADALDGLHRYMERLPRTREFGNGRLVRNLFEAALSRQASRVVASGGTDLTTLTLADLGLPDAMPDGEPDQFSTEPYL